MAEISLSSESAEQRLQEFSKEIALQEALLSDSVSIPAGRLRFFYSNWKALTSNSTILSWIKGYRIPFNSVPHQSNPIVNKDLSKIDENNISLLISDLKAKGVIVECEEVQGQFVSGIFLVPKANNKRLILNLKRLNKFIKVEHFKLEDYKTATKLVNENCYMSTIDLKDAYYLISIDHSHRKYLRFEFQGNLYEFTCLPFGLCTAPLVFTKLLKPVIFYLRKQGLRSVHYLHDFLLIGNTKEKCEINVSTTCILLNKLGFIINEQKSQDIPVQRCLFLGYIFDSTKMTIEIPDPRKLNIKNLLDKFSRLSHCKIREFAKFIGSLVACCPAIKYSWLYTKNFEKEKYLALLSNHDNYEAVMYLNQNTEDYKWWKANIFYGYLSKV